MTGGSGSSARWTVVAVIAFRYTGRGAVLTALAIPSVMALVFLVENGQVPVAITNSSAQLLVCALLGTLLRRGATQAAPVAQSRGSGRPPASGR